MNVMLKTLSHLKKREWLLVGFCALCVVVQVWLDLKIPDSMSDITRLLQTQGATLPDILSHGAWMLTYALGSLVMTVITAILSARIASNLAARLRSMQFDRVSSFSMQEMNRFSTASLITRSTNDVTQIQTLVAMGMQMLIKAPVMAVWAIAKIAGKSWQWTLSTGVAVAVLLTIVGTCIAFALPKIRKLQELTDNLNRVTRENLTGLRVVRAYNAEPFHEARFEEVNGELTSTNLFSNRMMAGMMPGVTLVQSGLTLAIYWIGAILIQSAGAAEKLLLFSDMVVFSAYAMQVVMSFMMLVMIFMLLPRAQVSAKRIQEVLDTQPSIRDGSVTVSPAGRKGEIEFRHVSFRYPGAEEPVIKDISFTARKGETVALVGSTGSGKSTILNLIPRFYDATEGEVLIDGVNVKDYKQTALRNKLGYVAQRATLFSGTVASNVTYGDNGKANTLDSYMLEAIWIAQASDFVEELEGEYGGAVAQGGSNFSGGQKQRLSIARAVCRIPEIFLFDDSFSALDYQTDRKLRTALKRQTADTTSLIVAQRIGTVMDADKIIVLDEGRIAGIGRHEELMQSCAVYQEIAYSQLSREELA